MTNLKKLMMNLQYFAADDGGGAGGTDAGANDGDAGKDDEPTVSVAEMKRRLEKANEKHQAAMDAMQAELDDKIKAAVDAAQAEANLTGKELQKYKEQEAQRKMDELKAENERLKLEGQRRELRDEAIRTLGEKKMPVNETILDFVVKDTADDTLGAIDAMAKLLNEQKEQFAQTSPPRTSGGMGGKNTENKSPMQILDDAKITDF